MYNRSVYIVLISPITGNNNENSPMSLVAHTAQHLVGIGHGKDEWQRETDALKGPQTLVDWYQLKAKINDAKTAVKRLIANTWAGLMAPK